MNKYIPFQTNDHYAPTEIMMIMECLFNDIKDDSQREALEKYNIVRHKGE